MSSEQKAALVVPSFYWVAGDEGSWNSPEEWAQDYLDNSGEHPESVTLSCAVELESRTYDRIEFDADGNCIAIRLVEHAKPQPAAHLTIPGALEWDGDNGTHGADGESGAHGECEVAPAAYLRASDLERLEKPHVAGCAASLSKEPGNGFVAIHLGAEPAEVRRLRDLLECSQGDIRQADKIMARQRVELDNLEQSRRSFFDLSQDLEKRLAERDVLLARVIDTGELTRLQHEELEGDICKALSPVAEPAKPKTCIECDQPHCHGVCVERGDERGDEHYDRDQAAKGGDDE